MADKLTNNHKSPWRFFFLVPKTIAFIAMVPVLMVVGVLGVVYSPWAQDALRIKFLEKINTDADTQISVGHFRLKFPLDLSLADVMVVSHGDTIVAASDINADVPLTPLLKGDLVLGQADLKNARYQIGAMDSASCMVIRGSDIKVDRSTLKLSPMDIHVSGINLDSARVSMWINPADTFPVKPPSPNPEIKINVDRIDYNDLLFDLQLMPTIHKLSARIADGFIDSVAVDLIAQTVNVGNFTGSRLDATYLMPNAAQIAATKVVVNPDKEPSEPWTIRVDKIDMSESKALYTTYGLKPEPGLDFNYIQVSDLDLLVTDFYNKASDITLPFYVSAKERCGIKLTAEGTLGIDPKGMTFSDFRIKTPTGTNLYADGFMGTEVPITSPREPLRLKMNGNVSIADVKTLFPAFRPYFVGMRPGAEIVADINVGGTPGQMNIQTLNLKVDRHIKIAASGLINNILVPKDLSGNVKFDIVVSDISNWTADLLAGTGVNIPAMTLAGNATFNSDTYSGNIKGTTGGGSIVLDGGFSGSRQKYNIDLDARDFPVNAFVPDLGIGKVTASIKGEGQGFDLFKASTNTKVDVDIKSIDYKKTHYGDIQLKANVADEHAAVVLDSYSSGLDLHLDAEGEIRKDRYVWDMTLNSNDLDLYKLGLMDKPTEISTDLKLRADVSSNLKNVDAALDLYSLEYVTPDTTIAIDDSQLALTTSPAATNVMARNHDLTAFYSSPLPLDSIMGRVNRVSKQIDYQYKHRKINIPALQRAVMPFTLDVNGGQDNILARLLGDRDIHYDSFTLQAANDSCLYMSGHVLDFKMDNIELDTLSLNIRQEGDRLKYMASVNNRPGTFDDYAHIDVDGFFETGQLGVNVHQRNIQGETGFDIGATLSLSPDSAMVLKFDPLDPVINYRRWHLNDDNFVSYDWHHRHVDADLRMKSDVSLIALYTENATDSIKEHHGADEDLVLQLFDIKIQDWLALDPFAPQITGDLSAGLRINWKDKYLNGEGTIDLKDLTYDSKRIGDFNIDLDMLTDAKGLIRTDAEVWINGEKTMTLGGALNDPERDSPFNLDFKIIHLPLTMANPFIPNVAKLGGTLNGMMDISGDMSNPRLNGFLTFDNATVDVGMLGSKFTMTHDSIPVRDNIVTFDDFRIMAANENPLLINGSVDIRSLASPKIDLALTADNLQLINTTRAAKGADVYGKAFLDLNSTAKGNLRYLKVNADVDLLAGTNVTYVLAGGAAALETQQASDMVKFVNFTDTAAVASADSLKMEGTIMALTANLNINSGTVLNVDLGTNAQDRVQLQGSGALTYVSSPIGDGRLTGRYTLSGGFIKYAPPLISNLNFNFTEGSYVAFSGDMLNPQLNIKAVERMRANVSQAGQNSRLIYFDIPLTVTGTLENFKVNLNLETDDDVTVANELASMSPTQRESEAMNLLIYNTYTGGSTKATSNLNGNPLFSFLTNSVNSWLANNVKGVDLSIGVDQYDQTTNGSTSTTTSYSYRVSKTLFNDRMKIIVGGSYSTDPNENGSIAENLINDVSIEYYLNNARTMYLRLFRHTGYESILEGEITQTGVGFVYKKRIGRLSDMFVPNRYKRKHRKAQSQEDNPQQTGKRKNKDKKSGDNNGSRPEAPVATKKNEENEK